MKFLARIPFVARRNARARVAHREHMEFLAALRAAGRAQAADPDTELTRRIYRLKRGRQVTGEPEIGRHRAA